MCTHNASGHGIGCQAIHIVTNNQENEEIKYSPPNLSEGGSLCSPIRKPLTFTTFG